MGLIPVIATKPVPNNTDSVILSEISQSKKK